MAAFWGFFTDGKGQASMSRLLCLLSFGPATYELVKLNSADALGWYLGAYVLGYIGGKFGEARNQNQGAE